MQTQNIHTKNNGKYDRTFQFLLVELSIAIYEFLPTINM